MTTSDDSTAPPAPTEPAAPPSDQPTTDRARRRRHTVTAGVAALALVGASLFGYALGNQDTAPPLAASSTAGQQAEEGAPPPPQAVGAGAAQAAPVTQGPVLPASEPTAITIPSIEVSSVVDQVGLNPDNTMEVPQPGPLFDNAAWYKFSPTPGELGPAVVIGHIDSAENGPSVFFDLTKLEPGQRIDVARADGTTATFEVERTEVYPKDEFPLQTVYGNTDHAALRLITCGGSFDSGNGSYEDNVVVFARMV